METSRESADALSNLLLEMNSGGVQVEDENSHRVSITAYFPPDDMVGERVSKITALLQSLREMNVDVGAGRVTMESVDEQDWSESWKEFFKPLPIGERILVYPSWEDVSGFPSRDILIEIEPGMAFGTGGHSTTKLCLELLESVLEGGERVARCAAIGDECAGRWRVCQRLVQREAAPGLHSGQAHESRPRPDACLRWCLPRTRSCAHRLAFRRR